MKNLFFGTSILAVLALAFSCTQDTSSENLDGAQELNAVEAKANVTRPIKAQLDFDFDYSNPTNIVPCIHDTMDVALFKTIVSGKMSHLGSFQPGSESMRTTMNLLAVDGLIPATCAPCTPDYH